MSTARNRAYRCLMSGYRYHAPCISRLTIGYRRGTLKALRDDFRELCRRIEHKTNRKRIDYFATWVNDFKDGKLRRHAHIAWTSPIVRWTELFPIWTAIVEDNATMWLDDMSTASPWKIGYQLQYAAMQRGESVRYSMSKAWLPYGYDHAWSEIRKQAGNDATTGDLIAELNSWIDRQRGIKVDTSEQRSLLPTKDWNDATLQVVQLKDIAKIHWRKK